MYLLIGKASINNVECDVYTYECDIVIIGSSNKEVVYDYPVESPMTAMMEAVAWVKNNPSKL